ncbi:MAG: DUF1559 domain-containing protein [Planctomycetes bacterium]|nr:DUF1559 domain-containing protein [Planctomycetota bacterium]
MVEMLVVIALISILIALLLPAIQAAREAARRTACSVKLKNLAIALHAYHDSGGKLPPSAFYKNGKNLGDLETQLVEVKPGDNTPGPTLAPYSFFIRLLPYIEQVHLYEQIDFVNNEAFAPGNTSLAAKVVPVLNCPSYRGPASSSAAEYGSKYPAITNYKALGATTLACLQDQFSVTHGLLNGGTLHPFAAYSFNTLKAPTQTAVLAETKEEKYAAWFDGTTASIPGFHPATGNVADDRTPSPPTAAPALNMGGHAPATPFCTAAQWRDFGSGGIADDMQWGPSSEHPGLVNHVFGGTETRSIANDVDPAAYRAVISRQPDDNVEIGENFK